MTPPEASAATSSIPEAAIPTTPKTTPPSTPPGSLIPVKIEHGPHGYTPDGDIGILASTTRSGKGHLIAEELRKHGVSWNARGNLILNGKTHPYSDMDKIISAMKKVSSNTFSEPGIQLLAQQLASTGFPMDLLTRGVQSALFPTSGGTPKTRGQKGSGIKCLRWQ